LLRNLSPTAVKEVRGDRGPVVGGGVMVQQSGWRAGQRGGLPRRRRGGGRRVKETMGKRGGRQGGAAERSQGRPRRGGVTLSLWRDRAAFLVKSHMQHRSDHFTAARHAYHWCRVMMMQIAI
jgi:hypothetical protein